MPRSWAERWTAQPIKRPRHSNKLRHSSSRWPTCRRSRPSSLRNRRPWRSKQAAAQQAAAAPAQDSLDAQLVQIQKLSVMKDQGLLTEEEFQAKKKQILGI